MATNSVGTDPTEQRVQQASDDAINKQADIMILGLEREVSISAIQMFNKTAEKMLQ